MGKDKQQEKKQQEFQTPHSSDYSYRKEFPSVLDVCSAATAITHTATGLHLRAWGKRENKHTKERFQLLTRVWSNWNSHTLFVANQNGAATFQNSWQFFEKLNILLPYNSVRFLPKPNEILCLHKSIYVNIHSRLISNHWKQESIQTEVHPINEILLSEKRMYS